MTTSLGAAAGPRRRAVLAGVLASITSCVLAGCGTEGPPRAAIAGAVSLGVSPLEAGVIRFVPTGGTKGPAAVATIRSGRYELPADEGPVVGRHRVEIEAIDHYGFSLDDEAAFTRHTLANRGRLPPNPVPGVYRDGGSPLTAEVPVEGLAACDFILNQKGSPPAGR